MAETKKDALVASQDRPSGWGERLDNALKSSVGDLDPPNRGRRDPAGTRAVWPLRA
jgi:hypothetical protein